MSDTFAADLAAAKTPQQALAALHRLSDRVTGARLFTVTLVDMPAGVVRRAYTSDEASYATSGTKPLTRDAFFETVMERAETFVANSPAEMEALFPDLALIQSLGCGACANLPVVRAGKVIATVNLLDAEGHWTKARLTALHDRLPVAAMAALAVHDLLA